MIKKAIILAAGNGTRLKPFTDDTPKCLIKVNGKPVIDRIIDHLIRHRITQIFVNLHHLPHKIYEHLGSRVFYTYEKDLLGEHATISIITNIATDEDWLITNGDTLTNLDIIKMYGYHKTNDAYITRFTKINFAGTTIISPYKPKNKILTYDDSDSYYFDIGNPDKLKIAREFYEKHNLL